MKAPWLAGHKCIAFLSLNSFTDLDVTLYFFSLVYRTLFSTCKLVTSLEDTVLTVYCYFFH